MDFALYIFFLTEKTFILKQEVVEEKLSNRNPCPHLSWKRGGTGIWTHVSSHTAMPGQFL